MLTGTLWPIVLIVTSGLGETEKAALREWLRNERRLGVRHGWTRLSVTGDAAASERSAQRDEAAGEVVDSRERARSATPLPTLSFLADDPDLPPMCRAELAVADAAAELRSLDEGFVRGCQKCLLHKNRTQTVFGAGHARPDLVFVGEGPGADEDREGEPFVGRAGQLLTRIIAAMTLTRDQVYIANVVKCRPPGNRTPTEEEMSTCSPYLWRQLAILRPKIIVALGRPAAQTLLAEKTAIGQLRGEFHGFPPPALAHLGLPRCRLMPTFHPAYLLRSPGEKAKAWEDLKQVMRALGISIPRPGRSTE